MFFSVYFIDWHLQRGFSFLYLVFSFSIPLNSYFNFENNYLLDYEERKEDKQMKLMIEAMGLFNTGRIQNLESY